MLYAAVLTLSAFISINAQINQDRDRDRDRYGDTYRQYGDPTRPYNDPSRPYDRNDQNRPYDKNDPNRFNDRNDPNRPYDRNDPNRPYNDPYKPNDSNGPPYDSSRPYDSRSYDPNRTNDPNRPYDSSRPNDPNRPYDPYRPNDPNRPNDPYRPNDPNRPYDFNRPNDSNRSYDSHRPYGSDPYNEYNRTNYDTNRNYNDPNKPYDNRDRYNDPNRNYGQNGYNNRDFDRFGGDRSNDFFNNFNSQPIDEDNLEEYCYSKDSEQYFHFGPKTSYDLLSRERRQDDTVVPGCTPVQFWTLVRQGTRYPKAFKIKRLRDLQQIKDQIIQNYEQRRSYPSRGRLCPDDYNLLRTWRWNESVIEEKGGMLVSQGVTELKLLARRYRSKYPQIFGPTYNDVQYYFQYAQADKTHDSYQAYIEGLFDNEYYKAHANTVGNDEVIKPYNNCPLWEDLVNRNPDTDFNYRKFLNSHEYNQMTKEVFRRLGFKFTLDPNIIQDIYDMCRYEKAWKIENLSPWCTAFTKKHLKILEYAEDLKEYHHSGYGNIYVEKLGCAPLRDLYRRFEKTVNGVPDGNKVTALFTHAATIQAVLTTMGIAKDYTALSADNYFQQTARRWKTSVIDPFGANLVATLYQCQSGEPFKIGFFLNEAPVDDLPGCAVGLCDWNVFQSRFQNVVDNCNVQAFCEGRSSGRSLQISSFLGLCALVWSALRVW